MVMTKDSAERSCTGTARTDPLMQRIRAEYVEMPGMTLLPAQAARLWSVERRRVVPLLDQLCAEGFLVCNAHGAYLRSDHQRNASDWA